MERGAHVFEGGCHCGRVRFRVRTEAQHSVTAQLISSQQQLATARDSKRATLSSIKVNEDQFVQESQALAGQSASLGAQIRANPGAVTGAERIEGLLRGEPRAQERGRPAAPR